MSQGVTGCHRVAGFFRNPASLKNCESLVIRGLSQVSQVSQVSFELLGGNMASVEIIGLLCAGSMRYHERRVENAGGNRRSGDHLSRDELAGLLSGLDAVAMNLALAKYANDLDAERLLIAQVRVWTAGIAVKELWSIVIGRPTVCNMAALAVFEVVRPNRCTRCLGRGFVGHRLCTVCNGSGHKHLAGSKIAEAIGIEEHTFRRLWRPRFEQVMSFVQGIDTVVNRVVYRADHEVRIDAKKSC